MKGILVKSKSGWHVRYTDETPFQVSTIELPLHPNDVAELTKYSDYSEDWTGKEVEFVLETYNYGGNYAKLIEHVVDPNEMIDDRKGGVVQDHLETLAKVLAKTWFYGDWKWETPNERVMQFIMVELGLYPFIDEDSMTAKTQVSEDYYRLAAKYVKGYTDSEMIDKDFANLKKNLEKVEYYRLGYNTAKRNLFTQEEMIEWTMAMIGQYAVGNTNIWNRELLKESLPKK